jgi:alpha-glucosidase (family GH31 glycosyl hydrolase)
VKLHRCPSLIFGRSNLCPPQIFGGLFLLVLLLTRFEADAGRILFAGAPAELVICEVSERTLRITLSPQDENGRPSSAPPSAVLVPFPSKVLLQARELAGEKTLRIGKLRVAVKPEPLSISVRDPNGKLVQELVFAESNSTNFVSFRADAPMLGLGEGANQFDRRGHFYRMINGQIAPFLGTHGATIPVPFLIGTDGWALFAYQPWGEFDLRGSEGRFIFAKAGGAKAPIDMFLISVPDPADALAEFIRLTGKPVMPPKWLMGYIQSHRTLLGPDDALGIARTFREKQLPCDALIYLGTGYCTNGWNVVNGTIDFNTNAFPHPAEQIKALQNEHFKVILHVNQAPRNLFGTTVGPRFSDRLPDGTRGANLFFRGPYLSRSERQALGVPIPVGTVEDYKSPLQIRNYWTWHRPVFALGVDGWWPDDGDELPIEARIARHVTYYEGPLLDRPNERPWSLHRNGYAGVARYGGWIWSGDTQSRWATLAAHVPVGLNYSLSLTPFWGTDIAGFVPTDDLTGELYVRWFQFATFNPLFRSHGRTWHLRLPWGWNTGESGPLETNWRPNPDELHNAEVEPICRKYLELRYRLLPFNYTIAREACDTGLPMMRALWLHYPNDPEAVKLGDEYLWGRDLLVAPVVEKGAKSRRVYLPEGNWFDWWTGEKLAGKRWIERPVDLASMPIYARAGAVIPLDQVRQYTSQPASTSSTLRVFPGADGEFTLYDDDGQSLGYLNGSDSKETWISLRWQDATRKLTIAPERRMKKWSGGTRVFDVEVAGSSAKPMRIEFAGRPVEVTTQRLGKDKD